MSEKLIAIIILCVTLIIITAIYCIEDYFANK